MACDLNRIYDEPGRVVVTAHRGFSGRHPENTLEAFRAAVEIGADLIEFDLRLTRDGQPIVLHDAGFERTAGRPGGPADYALADLRRFPGQDNPATRIPTFAEVLDTISDRVGMNIQIKEDSDALLETVCRMFSAGNLYARAYLSLPSFEAAERVHRMDPAIERCLTDRERSRDPEALERLAKAGIRYVQPRARDVTPAFCRMARAMGFRANLFKSNTDADNRRYIAMGIQGILTDYPDVLIQTLGSSRPVPKRDPRKPQPF